MHPQMPQNQPNPPNTVNIPPIPGSLQGSMAEEDVTYEREFDRLKQRVENIHDHERPAQHHTKIHHWPLIAVVGVMVMLGVVLMQSSPAARDSTVEPPALETFYQP